MTHVEIFCMVCDHLITEHTETDLQHCNLVLPLMADREVEDSKSKHKKSKAVK